MYFFSILEICQIKTWLKFPNQKHPKMSYFCIVEVISASYCKCDEGPKVKNNKKNSWEPLHMLELSNRLFALSTIFLNISFFGTESFRTAVPNLFCSRTPKQKNFNCRHLSEFLYWYLLLLYPKQYYSSSIYMYF